MKEITITKEEFTKIAMEVVADESIEANKVAGPAEALMVGVLGIKIAKTIENKLFGKEAGGQA